METQPSYADRATEYLRGAAEQLRIGTWMSIRTAELYARCASELLKKMPALSDAGGPMEILSSQIE